MKENQVILKRQKDSMWFKLDEVRPLAFFVILACLVGWIPYIFAAVGDNGSPTNWPFGPLVAAAIVSAFLGRAGLKTWWRRLTTFRAAPGWYILAFVAPVVIVSAAVLANSAFGAPLPTASQLARWTDLPGVFVIYLLLVGIGEEVGWTAFAAPLVLRRHTFINAWLILAAIRVFWHLPLMITGQLPLTLGIGGDIAFQFLMLWLFRRSGRVWLLAAIWHAMLNTTGGEFFFHMVQDPDQARLGLLFTIAYVLMAVTVYLFDHRHLDSADECSRADEAFAVDSPLVLFQRGNLVMSELEDDAAAGKATNARCAARDKWVTCDRRNQWARGDSFASLCIIGLLTLIVIAFIQRRTTKREYRATTGEAQGSSATQPPAIVASRMK